MAYMQSQPTAMAMPTYGQAMPTALAMPTAMAMPTYGQAMPMVEQAYAQPIQTAPVMGLQQYGTQQFPMETIPAVSYAPQYAAAPMVEYAQAVQAAPMEYVQAAPVMEYAQAPAYTTIPAVQTFEQAPAVYEVAQQYAAPQYAAAPTTSYLAPAPSYQPAVSYAAAPVMTEAAVSYAAAPAVMETVAPSYQPVAMPSYQPVMEYAAPAPMPMTYATPSYTPAPALQTQGSYYMTPGNLQQSTSMVAYPGFQGGAGGPFNFVANPTAVAQPQVAPQMTQNQMAEAALEAKITNQRMEPAEPRKKKVSKKTKKGCC